MCKYLKNKWLIIECNPDEEESNEYIFSYSTEKERDEAYDFYIDKLKEKTWETSTFFMKATVTEVATSKLVYKRKIDRIQL